MEQKSISRKTMQVLLYLQKGELTEHLIYQNLAKRVKDKHNSEILRRIGEEELRHARIWEKMTGKQVKPNRIKASFYSMLALLLGYT
ncbi:MAG: rubrerythrin family protein, partial [Spirochaetales bacterium]|nr:rubrerythrin family protein [Spirochaetales bacterium]